MANLPQIVFCTGNQGKLREVNAILDGHVKVVNRDVDLPELQGEPEDIAKAKAKEACRVLGEPVLTEDTSLCFEALGGLPGPYIKWFLKKLKVEGLPNMLAAYEDKSAYAQCIFGFCRPGEEPITFVGRCPGKIIAPTGPRNFGWDPVFCPDEQEGALSFAEMEPAEKNKISHRGRALEKVLEYFCEPSSKKQRTEE